MKSEQQTRVGSLLVVLTVTMATVCPASISGGPTGTPQYVPLALDELSTTTIALLELTLKSIDAGLEFMNREHQHVNLDAIIGTRIVEGQLSVLLRHLPATRMVTLMPNFAHDVQALRDKAVIVSDLALPYVQHTDPNYYKKLWPLIQSGFWTQDHVSRDIDMSLVEPSRYLGEAMGEEDSDFCLSEMLGTGSPDAKKCTISDKCWTLMTSPGYNQYSLSHEVFYLEIGEAAGCFGESRANGTDGLAAVFCANMLVEAEDIARMGYPDHLQDIFMEDQALCGILGYRQFFRSEWLQQIIQAQLVPRGCWSTDVRHHARRMKREEKRLADGCLSHRTAVALGALANYVRFASEYLLLRVEQQPHQ